MSKANLYPRYLGRHLLEALEDSPVVLVHGPRQCGKTTFAQSVFPSDGAAGLATVADLVDFGGESLMMVAAAVSRWKDLSPATRYRGFARRFW